MTTAKRDRGISEKRCYSMATQGKKPHSSLTVEEITEFLVRWGIIGRRQHGRTNA